VVVREKLATWTAETADVGARGCRITLKRPVVRGALLQILFDGGDGAEPVEAVGQVVWTRNGEPPEAGVAFVSAPRLGTKPSSWIDALAVAQLRRAARDGASAGGLTSLREAVLRLGTPPKAPLPARALAVVKVAEREGRISEVPGGPDALETLAALLGDGTVTLGAAGGDAQGWKRALSLPPAVDPPKAPAAGVRAPAGPTPSAALVLVPAAPEAPAATPPPLPDPRASRVAAMIAESLLEGADDAQGSDGARVA